MSGEMEVPASEAAKTQRPRSSIHAIWTVLSLIALLVLFLNHSDGYLNAVADADKALADAIMPVTPAALIRDFNERIAQCDYQWLVHCTPKAMRSECLRSDVACNFGDIARRYDGSGRSFAGAAWGTVESLARLPDATWYVLDLRLRQGLVPFGLLLAFIAFNFIAASRFPVIIGPVTLPFTSAIASALFWFVQQTLLLAATGIGVAVQSLLFAASVPRIVIGLFEFVRGGSDAVEAVHKAREVKGFIGRMWH